MKILYVSQYYYPVVGGVEIHTRQVAHEFAKNHQVAVVTGNFTTYPLPGRFAMLHNNLLAPYAPDVFDDPVWVHALTPRWHDRLRMLPIAVRAIPRLQRYAYHTLHEFGYRWFQATYLARLQQLMQGVDLVHSLGSGYLGWTAQAAARSRGIPFVCTPVMHPGQWGCGPLSVASYQQAEAIIALQEGDRQNLLAVGVPEERLHVIGHSPDLPPTADPAAFRQQYGLQDVPVILFVGRMVAHKGAKAVLDAAQLVWQSHPDARFVFVGPTTTESLEWFKQTDPRILCLGKVSLQDKANALAACDIFCMPSTSETLGIVYLEAWTYGKPVIGGKKNGLEQLIEGNQAGICADQDPAEISRAIVKLLSDPALRQAYGRAGQTLVHQKFSVAAVASSLEALYREQIQQHPCPTEKVSILV
jgi:phosphatidyl-myo-inositol dimannoside synthase